MLVERCGIMESLHLNRPKRGRFKTIIIIILLVLLWLSLGYIIYDKVYSEDSQKLDRLKSEVSTLKNNQKETKTKLEQLKKANTLNIDNKEQLQLLKVNIDNINSIGLLVTKQGEVYLQLPNATLDQKIANSFNTLSKNNEEYTIDGYHNEPCSGQANIFTGLKLDINNVIGAYNIQIGSDNYSTYIAFVKVDGTVDALNMTDLLYNGQITIKQKVQNLQNIVAILQSTTVNGCLEVNNAYAVDKTGKLTPIFTD